LFPNKEGATFYPEESRASKPEVSGIDNTREITPVILPFFLTFRCYLPEEGPGCYSFPGFYNNDFGSLKNKPNEGQRKNKGLYHP
jgi:hypothetical protein